MEMDKDIFYYYDLEEKSYSLKRFDDVLLAKKKLIRIQRELKKIVNTGVIMVITF